MKPRVYVKTIDERAWRKLSYAFTACFQLGSCMTALCFTYLPVIAVATGHNTLVHARGEELLASMQLMVRMMVSMTLVVNCGL